MSFGSTSSTAELPFFHSHASVPSHLKDGLKFPKDLIRLSIGLEHVNDIISDLDNAIKSAFNETGFTKTSTTRKLSMPTLNQRRNFSTYRGSSTTSVMGGEHKTRPPISDTLTTPIALSAAYWFKDSQELMDFATGKHNSYEYGRYGNPTTRILENKILHLESGNEKDHDCLMFASGMSASTTMFMAMVEPGGHVVTTKDCYRRTRQFIAVRS